MTWRKPEDLELIAECENLPELEVVTGLLKSANIESTSMTTTGSLSGVSHIHPFVFGDTNKPKPFKLLVKPEDAEAAREILTAIPEDLQDDDE